MNLNNNSLNLKNNFDFTIEEIELNNGKAYINPKWNSYSLSNFLNKVNKIDAVNNENSLVLYNKRNLLYKYNFMDTDLAVKKFILKRTYDKLRFRFLDSKALRSLKIALALNKIGVNTPAPVAVRDDRGHFNKLINSYYITEYVNYDYNLLDIVKDNDHPLRYKIKKYLPYIARDARKMHDAGIIHNDFHAGNILCKDNKNHPEFYYIDLNRARIKKNITRKKRIKDLARLDLKENEKEIFFKNYSPKNYRIFIKLMKKQRNRRRRLINIKRKIRGFLNIRK